MDCCCRENVQKLKLLVNLRTRSTCTYMRSQLKWTKRKKYQNKTYSRAHEKTP